MKSISLFSGIGAFEKAASNLKIQNDLVAYCEIDKYADRSYCTVHQISPEKNLGDITKVDEKKLPKDIDLITYGFPCQDISVAGHQKGFFNPDGTQTRSGLFFEAMRIIEEVKPKYAIAENVKNLTGKKFALQFKIVLNALSAAGYNNYWKVLNAKNYGVPQNRERVFIVSIRKDVDDGSFQFPVQVPLKTRLCDILEDVVDESFYLTEEQCKRLTGNNFHQANSRLQKSEVCDTLLARDHKDPKVVCVAQMYPNSGNPQAGRIYDENGLSPALDTCSWGNRMPKIMEKTEKFRKLTPKECWRLMGFDDPDFDKAKEVNSNTQLYKQAGNSIVVPVVEAIYKQLFNL